MYWNFLNSGKNTYAWSIGVDAQIILSDKYLLTLDRKKIEDMPRVI